MKDTYTEHFRTLVRSKPARWAHTDPTPHPTPPDFSAGYTLIYAHQADDTGQPTPLNPGCNQATGRRTPPAVSRPAPRRATPARG